MCTHYPAKKPKEEAKGTCHMWSQPPDIFLLYISVPKYKARVLCQRLKKAFNPKKGCEQNNKNKKGTCNVPSRNAINFQ